MNLALILVLLLTENSLPNPTIWGLASGSTFKFPKILYRSLFLKWGQHRPVQEWTSTIGQCLPYQQPRPQLPSFTFSNIFCQVFLSKYFWCHITFISKSRRVEPYLLTNHLSQFYIRNISFIEIIWYQVTKKRARTHLGAKLLWKPKIVMRQDVFLPLSEN